MAVIKLRIYKNVCKTKGTTFVPIGAYVYAPIWSQCAYSQCSHSHKIIHLINVWLSKTAVELNFQQIKNKKKTQREKPTEKLIHLPPVQLLHTSPLHSLTRSRNESISKMFRLKWKSLNCWQCEWEGHAAFRWNFAGYLQAHSNRRETHTERRSGNWKQSTSIVWCEFMELIEKYRNYNSSVEWIRYKTQIN